MEEDTPRKAFYTIGEVSHLTGVRPHVLRYWEEQGKLLKPSRRRSRHRLYRPADIQLVLEIKRLRQEEKWSLAALRRQFSRRPQPNLPPDSPAFPAFPPPANQVNSLLRDIRDELLALKEFLE